MANEPLAAVGHVVHIYDFRVKPGMGDQFFDGLAQHECIDRNRYRVRDAPLVNTTEHLPHR